MHCEARNGIAPGARGFTLLELVVVIVIVGVLLVVAINRLLPYIDAAERVAVLSLESQLKSTLVMAAAKRIARGQSASIVELERSNPMALLLEPPDNYIGERRADPAELPARRWYFNPATRRLVYRIGEPHSPELRGRNWENPQFEVRVSYRDRDADGVFNAGKDELYGVRLLRMAGADWLAAGKVY
ncbi:MAG: prepilin-type N-terminal cleavage/methylation domain-containing protein [Woeseiaceae bacterium]|nr:prepilin-type N-terminal cleavage/methylation domain-containing protein [Woeseiaceae bacterium]